MPVAQVQQAAVLLALGGGQHLFGNVLENVTKALLQVHFLGYPALVGKTDDLHFNGLFCEL